MLLIAPPLAACSSRPPEPAGAVTAPAAVEFGTLYAGPAKSAFDLTNHGDSTLTITRTEASCGCMAYKIPVGTRLAPRERTTVEVGIDLSRAAGEVEHSLTLHLSNGQRLTVPLRARVLRGIVPQPAALEYDIREAGASEQRRVTLNSDDGARFQILGAHASTHVHVDIDPDSSNLLISVANRDLIESLTDSVVIETTHPRARSVRVPLVARFRVSWAIEPQSVTIARWPAENEARFEIDVVSRRGVQFTVPAFRGDRYSLEPASRKAADRQRVVVRVPRSAFLPNQDRLMVTLPTEPPLAEWLELPVVLLGK